MVEYTPPPRTTPCTPSELHPYIYSFLVEHGLPKTAKHLKKEAGKECCEKPSGDSLLEIFSKHMCAEPLPVYSAVPPPTLDETPAQTDTPAVPTEEDTSKKSKKKKRKLEEAEVKTTQVTEVVESEEKPKKKKKKSKKDEVTEQPAAVVEQPAVVEEPAAIVEESPKIAEPTEDESTTNTTEETVEPVKTKKKKKKKSKSDISPPATTEETTTPQVTEETAPTVEAVNETPTETEETKENNSSSENTASEDTSEPKVPKTKKLKKNESFRRVIAEDVIVPDQLADNSFDAKIGARGDWGQKANEDLRFTKGKSFRHEKTKKKRGSYRGGNINVSVNSIKFSDDED